MSIPFNDLSRLAASSKDEILAIVERVIASGWYILGAEVATFESACAQYIGTKYCVGVNSGTDALAISLRALDVGPGDEVITVANASTPTIAAIRTTGAIPVFADIDESHTMDPKDLEQRITKKTKVILPIHLYGYPADMKAIQSIAHKHGLRIVEDGAQAIGATIEGVRTGNFSDLAAFSFFPTKNLGAFGDAGAVVTNDAQLAERVRRLRVYGWKSRYDSVEEGINSRLDEMQAALLSWGLTHLDTRNARRREIADMFRSSIKNSDVVLPNQKEGDRDGVWHLFVIQVDDRARFVKHMEDKGVGVAIHYPLPVYRQDAYSFLAVDPAQYPTTERIGARVVSLPLFPELTDNEVQAIISAVNSYSAR